MDNRAVDKEIFALALPALGALITEPLMRLADSAMVGHLGTAQLAGLSIGVAFVGLITGTCIFLAYTTTAITSRRLGAGQPAQALRGGIDGMWLAAILGIVLAIALYALSPTLAATLGARGQVLTHAVAYLRASSPGLIAMLIVLAGTGTLRGLLDTRTPLLVATSGSVANVIFNAALIYGLGLGVTGAGLGTSLAQFGMALAYITIVWRAATTQGVPCGFAIHGVFASSLQGAPLVVRSVSLQLLGVLTVGAATALGPITLAAHQVINSTWSLAAFTLDAIAIAASALTGHRLGVGDVAVVRQILRRCLFWGVVTGMAIGVLLILASPLLPHIFTTDPHVVSAAKVGLIVAACAMPLAGIVFMWDGVLIGANDSRYLAVAYVSILVCYAPLILGVRHFGHAWTAHFTNGANQFVLNLLWVWLVYAIWAYVLRGLFLTLRGRGTQWMQNGA
ncbi:MAG: MATE family efflux transporter [Actinomycetaceae bacterium]|nr:MATE family efflux transporter [Actinomycetaceae bacterium]